MTRGTKLVLFGLVVVGLALIVFTAVLNLIAGLPLAVGAMR
jgi:hypothetical protein